jgi:hypothetical protein
MKNQKHNEKNQFNFLFQFCGSISILQFNHERQRQANRHTTKKAMYVMRAYKTITKSA